MRSLTAVFVILLGLFLGSWIYRAKQGAERPDEYREGYDENAGSWWNDASMYRTEEGWSLKDMDVPDNYKPVPGQSNLFMVVDTNGRIICYMRREKQIDGSWKWEQVNPDIPENYEAVEGLEDVYRVTDEEGNVSYYKYIRNEDDTFAFIPCDEKGNPIGRKADATTIDSRHVNITGNIYSLLNEHGVVIGYQRRKEKEDGSFVWEDVPDFEEMAKRLKESGDKENSSKVDMDALYEDLSNEQDAGSQVLKVPDIETPVLTDPGDPSVPVINITMPENGGQVSATPGQTTVINNADGSITKTKIIRETRTEDGRKTTYESKITQVYNEDGTLRESKTDGPYPVKSGEIITDNVSPVPDPDAKASSLTAEKARFGSGVSYDDSIEDSVIASLNAQRVENSLPALRCTEEAKALARLRAADMMKYDTTDTSLPTYGTLSEMLAFYGIESDSPGENVWKTQAKDASDIHARLQASENARKTRMGKDISQVGVAVAWDAGKEHMYYCEVFL